MLVQARIHKITKMEIQIKKFPANEHIEFLLQSGKSFVACYGDLDHFKPFNDKYGHRKGDDLIQFTANLLSKVCDPAHDFIEHIGSDDFILILQSKDWEHRCHQALTAFAQSSSTLFEKKHCTMGGYITEDRQSRIVHHPLPTLSIGAVIVTPEWFGTHYEVIDAATSAIKMAKKNPGNSLFVERRQPNPYQMSAKRPSKMEVYYG